MAASRDASIVVYERMAFAVLGTGLFVGYASFASTRREKATPTATIHSVHGDAGTHTNDMPLLSNLDSYPLDPRGDAQSNPVYPRTLVRRETPLLERCGSSTVSDYHIADETELKPLSFEVEAQRYNVQMRSAHPFPTPDNRFNMRVIDEKH
ncbi:hypothetical protein H310_04792 [Aphanomyces invadans]|uniref:Uncharacterized protein n=1 Tax=Aphanomyces invadans TaxID=157072 RepID=A0A024UBM3_9STRA|nr:hypothetical protein H310_04792 [Aphanomyces invadans]ETW03287.1 hypothetical protein H310_04792 [Aphanomyces invadans]|eukprot:XP_008867516.1 hypothetical protein H310_04792 [Aphanomyces invadans]